MASRNPQTMAKRAREAGGEGTPRSQAGEEGGGRGPRAAGGSAPTGEGSQEVLLDSDIPDSPAGSPT